MVCVQTVYQNHSSIYIFKELTSNGIAPYITFNSVHIKDQLPDDQYAVDDAKEDDEDEDRSTVNNVPAFMPNPVGWVQMIYHYTVLYDFKWAFFLFRACIRLYGKK